MTPTLWTAFREFTGLPGNTRVTEIPSETLAMFFLSSHRRREDVVTEQEMAEKKKKEKSVTHRCLDCGHMWEGQPQTQPSSPAMGNISQYPAAVEEPEEEV